MKTCIKALAYYLPETVVTNEQLVEEFPEWTVEKIAAKVGVNQRHIARNDIGYGRESRRENVRRLSRG